MATPQIEARAFRIWAFAKQHEWKVSVAEISKYTGLSKLEVIYTLKVKKWQGRLLRSTITPRMTALGRRSQGMSFDDNSLDLCDIMRLS